jgi:hypothetical protein
MKIRRIDSEGDWDYGHSMSSYYVDNAQSVGLNIVTRLREWYRDCFFAMDKGIDYPTRLGTFNQKDNLDNDLTSYISTEENGITISGKIDSFKDAIITAIELEEQNKENNNTSLTYILLLLKVNHSCL